MGRDGAEVSVDARIALEVLSLLSKKWHPVVIVVLDRDGPMGFNDLLGAIPEVSGKVLSGTLESLSETGVIERTVVSESPLRVEYELTHAGVELTTVFDDLAEWGHRHLGTGRPTVLIADADRRITEMYEGWLDDRYAALRAHNGEELEARLEAAPDVVVFEKDLPGADPDGIIAEADVDCRTIVLVGDRPGVDIVEIECDDVLRKPIVRRTALEAIDVQLERRGEPVPRRKRRALAAKRSLLEACLPPEVLETTDEYADLCTRLDRLASELDESDSSGGSNDERDPIHQSDSIGGSNGE